MPSLNKAIIAGHVGKEPLIRRVNDNTPVASFSVATSERWKDKATGEWKEKTEWHNVVAWGQLAEKVERSVAKGSSVYIDGKIQTRKWTDKDGNDRYTTEIKADAVNVLDSKKAAGFDPSNVRQEPVDNGDDLPF